MGFLGFHPLPKYFPMLFYPQILTQSQAESDEQPSRKHGEKEKIAKELKVLKELTKKIASEKQRKRNKGRT